jgi:hypothetical protein
MKAGPNRGSLPTGLKKSPCRVKTQAPCQSIVEGHVSSPVAVISYRHLARPCKATIECKSMYTDLLIYTSKI